MWQYLRRVPSGAGDDEHQLGVRLHPDEAVDDVTARLLKLARPGDVRPLVEPRLELHHHHDLLARLGRVDEGVHDRALAACSVHRLLDGEHPGVGGGLLDQSLHGRRERVVGVVYHDVARVEGGDDGSVRRHASVRHEPGYRCSRSGRVGDGGRP
jgi:hypothetical protein